ncbi:MAG: hypothetical protein M3680_10120, partial [Myxococcota bacterium]|nr:hypothetical protein [Myxococcota bacterium]
MSARAQSPFLLRGAAGGTAEVRRAVALALAALGPVAIGGILAIRAQTLTPLMVAPAIIFGVVAATSPALYIALAATGTAPP